MTWIARNIHWLMTVSGVLTLTMLYAVVAPDAALRSTFGESLGGPVADIVVRNWGALIGLMGAMLIYAARKPAVRPLALTVAGASKAIFIALVLSHGARFLGYQAGVAVIVDLLWVLVFAVYLATRRAEVGAAPLTTTGAEGIARTQIHRVVRAVPGRQHRAGGIPRDRRPLNVRPCSERTRGRRSSTDYAPCGFCSRDCST